MLPSALVQRVSKLAKISFWQILAIKPVIPIVPFAENSTYVMIPCLAQFVLMSFPWRCTDPIIPLLHQAFLTQTLFA